MGDTAVRSTGPSGGVAVGSAIVTRFAQSIVDTPIAAESTQVDIAPGCAVAGLACRQGDNAIATTWRLTDADDTDVTVATPISVSDGAGDVVNHHDTGARPRHTAIAETDIIGTAVRRARTSTGKADGHPTG
jgi:hypothetical protein